MTVITSAEKKRRLHRDAVITLICKQVLGIGLIPLTAGMSVAMNVMSANDYLTFREGLDTD